MDVGKGGRFPSLTSIRRRHAAPAHPSSSHSLSSVADRRDATSASPSTPDGFRRPEGGATYRIGAALDRPSLPTSTSFVGKVKEGKRSRITITSLAGFLIWEAGTLLGG